MLQKVRGALKGVVAWFVIALLVLSFAAFGVPEIRNFARNAAVEVGDRGFSAVEIQNEFNREMTNRRAQSDGAFTRADAIAQGVPQQVISDLVTQSALQQAARELGLTMPRDVVSDFLHETEQFQNPTTGDFDPTVLNAILASYNMSAQTFEALIREDLLRNQLIAAFAAGGRTPDALVNAILLRDLEEREVSYAVVDEELAGIPAEPTPDDLERYYRAHAAEFTTPELRTFSVVQLTDAGFQETLDVDEARLREIYEDNRARLYEQPEKRTLYQVTFDTAPAAEAAVAALRQGRAFEDIADERGLSLAAATFEDISKADVLDPNVAEAAFAEDIGEGDVVGPVEGLFGYTVAEVGAVTPPETQEFEEVRDDIAEALMSSDTRKKLLETLEAIENEQDTGASLAEAAGRAGVQVTEYGPVDRYSFGPGGEIVADLPGEILEEAFALEEGAESTAVEMREPSGYFFVAVDTVAPSAVKPYDVVADEVAAGWRRAERDARIADAVEGVRRAIADGASLDDAAGPLNAAVETLTLTRRATGAPFSERLIEDMFAAEPGAVVTGAAGAGAAQVVAVIDEVNFNTAAFNPAQAAFLEQYVARQLDQELIDAYAAAVRDDLGVKINQAAVDAIFSEGS